ncbi:MAG: hypothetical protein US89_C0002G0009 [Candidatus Peregrinibacteria bacterium GW2011_GWF2_38_29]|nr:MAG: hypothetical protein US89_C0002G0009 [Candidatus Peregrinibacteria bacterium GW2011_GWF2_38_29]HBB02165.1 hypothetical protein [Candidatus Peregrinibacteria bacterium]
MSFLSDYKKLLFSTPKQALTQWNCENSDYNVWANHSKNSYMTRGSGWMKDCFYLYWVYHALDVSDCAYCERIELCYECVDCNRCYNCDFCQDCKDSNDLVYSYDCTGCKNCLGCIGLVKKEFCVFNEQKTKEEYEAILKNKNSTQIVSAFEDLKSKIPHRDFILKSENCVGNHIENSQNCFYCFDTVRSRDGIYNFNGYENIDSVDCSFAKEELSYERVGGGWNFNCDYGLFLMNCVDCKFCFQLQDCKNCFGCDALHHKRFCILNKEYSEEEYFKKTAEIWAELKNSIEAGDLMSVFEDSEYAGIEH